MRKLTFVGRALVGMLALTLLLAACSGGTTNGSTGGTPTPHATSDPSSSGTTSVPTKSTVTFTASGGLTGSYSVSDNDRGSNYAKNLVFLIGDQNWNFTLSYSPYTGPGTFTLNGPPQGNAALESKDGKQSWRLTSTPCQMTVVNDTSVNNAGGGAQYHELKGSFSCPSLTAPSGPPLAISNGQFDVVALVVP